MPDSEILIGLSLDVEEVFLQAYVEEMNRRRLDDDLRAIDETSWAARTWAWARKRWFPA